METSKVGPKKTLFGNRCLTIKMKKEMKKNLFMVAAVALMALVSCNKEEANNGAQEPASDIVFVAEFEKDADTKIALGELVDGVRKTTWVAGDKIKINGTEFSAKEAGESSEFTTTGSFTEAATYRAVYPAASYISTTAVDIPATQDGTFANAAIAVAESATTSLKFNNLVTILKFQVPVNCSKVTFESTASLAGRITVNYTDGVMTPDYAGVTQPNKTINVTGSFVPGTDYYVAVKPATHTFTVKIDGKVSKASTTSVTVERSKILNMGELPEPVDYKLYIEDDTGYSELYLYLYDASSNNTWPGAKITDTETINGVTYKVYTVPEAQQAKEYTYIFNNNKKSQVEENKKIKFDKNNYLRVTKKYSEVVDASNKGKSDPITLYIRNDKNWSKLNYYMWIPGGATNAGWPGKSVDMNKKTKIDDATYYYVELGAHSYTRIIINDGSNQTADMTIKSTTEDIYAANNGYCWKGSEQAL